MCNRQGRQYDGSLDNPQALVAEHLFRRAIEEGILAGIAGFDVHGKQIYVNAVFCEMVGWPEAVHIDKPFPQLKIHV